jgi:hypothetical protein
MGIGRLVIIVSKGVRSRATQDLAATTVSGQQLSAASVVRIHQ